MKKLILLLFILSCSCKQGENERVSNLVREWSGKEILFPDDLEFTSLGNKVPSLLQGDWDYAIVSYVDSLGCLNCKLQLDTWSDFIRKKDTLSQKKVELLFFMHPLNRKELLSLLREHGFAYPVCIDTNDVFNRLNHFPTDVAFQTFLLNRDNKVVAIGNPIHNPNVKELYTSIICDKHPDANNNRDKLRTTACFDRTSVSLGSFSGTELQKVTFMLKNIGEHPLIVDDVIPSCDCVGMTFSHDPVSAGNVWKLNATYKADGTGPFEKTIDVFCNVPDSPLQLRITGSVK